MRKKICYFSPVSIHSYRWIETFRKKGYDISLVTDFRTWMALRPRNIPVYSFPTVNRRNLHYRLVPNFVSILRILRKIKPDLVHLHMQHHYAPIVYLDRVSYILHSWGLEVLELGRLGIVSRVLAKQAAMKARKVIVDAKCLKKIWTSIGIPENKVEVIPFGVDTRLFNPNANGNSIRKRLGISENDSAIISTRPFFNHYNIECLVKAIPIVVKKHKNVMFVIKGKGPLESNIKKLAQKLRVEHHIRFTNLVPYHETAQYLTAANIYVSTSYIDTTSVSLLEAMACGLPPITTDIPGNREWVKNGVNGLLYPPKDHRALAERIILLLENEDLRRHFTEKSLRVIEERATWEECVSKMEAIYQSLI